MNRKPYFLSDVFEIIGGGTPRTTEPKYWNGPIPWLSVVDFNSDARYVYSTEKTITELGLVSSSTKLLNKGDLIISARGTVGAIAQIQSPMAFNQSCYGLRAKPDLLESNYGYYLLKDSVSTLKNNAHGGVFDTITRDTFKTILVELPGIESQKRISSFLGSLDHYIENLVRQNSTLESLAQTLFKSWFVNFDPVHSKAAGREPEGLSAEVAALFPSEFEESELGLIPKGWTNPFMDEGFDFKEGPGIRNWQYTNSDTGTKFINIRCIQEGDIKLGTANRITEEEANGKYSHFLLKSRDVVVSTSGTLGRSAIVRESHLPLCLNTSVIRFRENDSLPMPFIKCFLESTHFLDELNSLASGSVQKNFGPSHVKQIRYVRPSSALLKAFSEISNPFLDQVLNNRELIDTLSGIRDELLPRLISGKIRIEEAEEALESVLPQQEKKVA